MSKKSKIHPRPGLNDNITLKATHNDRSSGTWRASHMASNDEISVQAHSVAGNILIEYNNILNVVSEPLGLISINFIEDNILIKI